MAARVSDSLATLGRPALIGGENEAEYIELLSRIILAAAPVDFIEQVCVREYVDLTWEIMRIRRLKAAVVQSGARQAFQASGARKENWISKLDASRATVGAGDVASLPARHRTELDTNPGDLATHGYLAKLDDLERLDRLMAQAENRRRLHLMDIERRREAIARRLKESAEADDGALPPRRLASAPE